MKEMKAREQSVYDYIAKMINENGYSPSVRDIKEALGFASTSTVQTYIDRLIERGLLYKSSGKSRTLRLGERSAVSTKIPLLGDVAAGELTFPQSQPFSTRYPQFSTGIHRNEPTRRSVDFPCFCGSLFFETLTFKALRPVDKSAGFRLSKSGAVRPAD
jgi:DNA-binding transcriptional MocR family regulator